MVDRQIRDLLSIELREGRQRHLLAGKRRPDIKLFETVRIFLQGRGDFENHVVTIQLGEVLRHLALAEGVVKRIVDDRGLQAEARRLIAVTASPRAAPGARLNDSVTAGNCP